MTPISRLFELHPVPMILRVNLTSLGNLGFEESQVKCFLTLSGHSQGFLENILSQNLSGFIHTQGYSIS